MVLSVSGVLMAIVNEAIVPAVYASRSVNVPPAAPRVKHLLSLPALTQKYVQRLIPGPDSHIFKSTTNKDILVSPAGVVCRICNSERCSR